MKISDLFFKYIKDKHLERKGVTAEDLAKSLEIGGFIDLLDGENFDWSLKAKSGEFKREFWKCIDTTKPSLNQSRKPYQNRMLSLWLCSVLFGQGWLVAQQFGGPSMDLSLTHPTHRQRVSPSHCRDLSKLNFLFLARPLQRSVS